jgi:hypothetical protein
LEDGQFYLYTPFTFHDLLFFTWKIPNVSIFRCFRVAFFNSTSRFWHSTTAYAIANDCDYDDISNLPPIGHWVYQWPSDLIKPTLVLFLSVSEEIREERLAGRNEVLTWEEKKLSAKAGLFRKK